MPLELTFYTAATAPHLPVPELSDGKGRHRRTHNFDTCAQCRAHAATPTDPKTAPCYFAVCAACNWSRADVARLRAAKRRRINVELRRKSPAPLAPPVDFAPLFPRGFDPHAVILPRIALSNGFDGVDILEAGVARRYLESIGASLPKGASWGTWACGCETREGGELVKSCARHRRAFFDNAEEVA